MPHLHLPAQHTEEDLAVAGALATLLQSGELYVAWSLRAGPAKPVIPAALREPLGTSARPRPPLLRRLPALLTRVVARLTRRIAG